MARKKPVVFRDEISCIGCGQKSKGTYRDESGNKNALDEMVKARDTVFEAIGWRKVPGGWKCTNCTGIRGRTARW